MEEFETSSLRLKSMLEGLMPLELTVERARLEVAEAARALLNGTLSFIEGSRLIHGLAVVAKLDNDHDILPFIGIYSETDALPLGDERIRWAPEALIKLQPEIEKAEKWAREFALPKCQQLIDRFGGAIR